MMFIGLRRRRNARKLRRLYEEREVTHRIVQELYRTRAAGLFEGEGLVKAGQLIGEGEFFVARFTASIGVREAIERSFIAYKTGDTEEMQAAIEQQQEANRRAATFAARSR